MRDTVSERDVRVLLDAVHDGDQDEPGQYLPPCLLSGLTRVIPAETVTFLDVDSGGMLLGHQDYPTWSVPDEAELAASYRSHVGDCLPCRDPDRAGDRYGVSLFSDYARPDQHATAPAAEYFRQYATNQALMTRVRTQRAGGARFVLCRDGSDFSARERLLLGMLRPHLDVAYQRADQRRRGAPSLTPRQLELLALVAAGHSNAEIAATLVVSVGTVRKHLDNIYERLGVSSRAAAAACAFGYPMGTAAAGSAGSRGPGTAAVAAAAIASATIWSSNSCPGGGTGGAPAMPRVISNACSSRSPRSTGP
jgi:DNA-binding NarL/FixJ family response regulator